MYYISDGFLANRFFHTEADVPEHDASVSGFNSFAKITATELNSGMSNGRGIYCVPLTDLVPKTLHGQYFVVLVDGMPTAHKSMNTVATAEQNSNESRHWFCSNLYFSLFILFCKISHAH